jgi:hypothetical protein
MNFLVTTHFSQIVLGRRNRLCKIYLVGNELNVLRILSMSFLGYGGVGGGLKDVFSTHA